MIFFSPSTNCLQSAMLTAAATGILWHCHVSRNSAHKTELLLPRRDPGRLTSLPGSQLPEESLFLMHFNPRTPIPVTSHPQNSHPQVQCLLVQCYLKGSSSKDKTLKPGPSASLCLPDCLLGISQTMQLLHHIEESKSWPCLQVGPTGPKVVLGLPLITCGICTGSRRTMFKLKTALEFFLSLVFVHANKFVK